MTKIEIRKAVPEDLDELVLLCAEHASFERVRYVPAGKKERLRELLFDDVPKLQCLIACVERETVGYASMVQQVSTWSAGHYLYLDCLYIRPGHRGRGLGRQIMGCVQTCAKEFNCQEVQWQTPSFNQDAIRFYRRLNASSHEKLRYVWRTRLSTSSIS
ncbi:MAG: GNAT family N-acetyltransferase [Planctomycetota bacterium]